MMKTDADIELDALAKFTDQQIDNEHMLDWLLRQPAVVSQAFFWNYASRSERKKAIKKAMEAK